MNPPPAPVIPTSELDGRDSPVGNLSRAFEFAIHQREFEIAQLTQRNNFFMIFQGVLVAGIVQSHGAAAPAISFSVCLMGFVVSLFQVGMAAGSKFWQIRWERAAKTTELWLLEELKATRRVSNFMTADGNFLTMKEKARLSKINQTGARMMDPLTFGNDDIKKANLAEITQGRVGAVRSIENWLILRKYSVSRIPIWTAITLTIFWLGLLGCTVEINGKTLGPFPGIAEVKLVPLKGN